MITTERTAIELNQKSSQKRATSRGLQFKPYFVPAGQDPYTQVRWAKMKSQITDTNGTVVFSMDDVEVPEGWSQLATDIAVSKYFRRSGVPQTGRETSVRQLIYRVAHTIRLTGEAQKGYFATPEDARNFENELTHILLSQKAAFNSPVWFNCGLFHTYGTKGAGGSWFWDANSKSIRETENAFEHPQCSACFIQSVDDNLMDIFDLVKKEARIFRYGSGTGTNFSKVRGHMEKLSGGGTSSGLMSFLEVLDRGAGATKSGGTTRRAAKMVCLDLDHPEIEEFISWKSKEEAKVAALVQAGYSSDFNGEAYKTVSGQNSNNSVRIPDGFMEAVENDVEWHLTARTDGSVVKTLRARDLWQQIAKAAWTCADPGVQFDSTIQAWHTCPETDRINSSNPCSEYMFLDNSACNLSSLNLTKFLNDDGSFDVRSFRHAARIMLTAQEILVDFSSYPTEQIARNSHDYRPLGLGYANLGTVLMVKGIPYDSPEALAWTGAITAIMTGEAYRTSGEIAKTKGPFAGFSQNANAMLSVIKKHREKISEIDSDLLPEELIEAAQKVWDQAIELGNLYGFRNAQTTVLAPTGTIGLLMDCDTTGIEPDFALVKFKKLAGGGYFKIVNQSVPKALRTLGYSPSEVEAIVNYAVGTMNLEETPHINRASLRTLGLSDEELGKIETALPTALDLSSAVSPWILGKETLGRLKLNSEKPESLLEQLGFTAEQIKEASKIACGRMMLEGAPQLKAEHLAVFDCANKCGAEGTRFLSPLSHLRMMAAAQPFLSGAISKTVNMPNEATIDEVADVYYQAWKQGLKAVAIYRDGSKVSQVLNAKSSNEDKKERTYTQAELDDAVKQALASLPPKKRRMPQRRHGITVQARVGGHQVFLRSGEYENGGLGEIFIDMHKEGATLRSLLNCFAISVSMGLQYGVPLEDYVEKFTFTRFEPSGMVNHPNIKTATSVLDYVFRVLGMEYLGKTDFVHVQPAIDELAISRAHTAPREITQIEQPMSAKETASPKKDSISSHLSTMMGDAPMCTSCGHVTVRNGSCYRCLNCGTSMGCS